MAAVTSLAVCAATAVVAPAQADDAVVVRGTAFPYGTGLAHVGCTQIYDAGAPAQPYLAQGPGTAPLGDRSLGFDLPGGDAAGVVHYTASMAATTSASVSALAPQGATGVAWAGYLEPGQEGSGRVWFGRAPLSVPAGGWTSVEAAGLTYQWAQYDNATRRVVAAGPRQSVPDFAADHGSTGAGLWSLAFGCDGGAVNLDALRFADPSGTTTYDVEGLATSLDISSRGARVVAGDPVRISGELSATRATPLPHSTAILERRTSTSDGWQPVRVVDAAADGSLAAFVEPPTRTSYRWRFVDRPLAEASTSSTFTVDVARAVQARVSDDGDRVVGSVTPYRAGLELTLRRVDGAGRTVSATTDADGAFSLPLDELASGRYVVTIAADRDNLAGESAPLTVVADGRAPSPQPDPQPQPEPQPGPTRSPGDRSSESADPTPSPASETRPTPSPSGSPDSPSAPPPGPSEDGPGSSGPADDPRPSSAPASDAATEPVATPTPAS